MRATVDTDHGRMITNNVALLFSGSGPPNRITIGLPIQNMVFLICPSVDDRTVVSCDETCSKMIVLLPRNYIRQDINNWTISDEVLIRKQPISWFGVIFQAKSPLWLVCG